MMGSKFKVGDEVWVKAKVDYVNIMTDKDENEIGESYNLTVPLGFEGSHWLSSSDEFIVGISGEQLTLEQPTPKRGMIDVRMNLESGEIIHIKEVKRRIVKGK